MFRIHSSLVRNAVAESLSKGILGVIVLSLVACQSPMGGAGTGIASGNQGTSGFIFGTVYFILMGFFAYYFIVIKPAQVEEDTRKKFVDGLKKNTEVRTSGGLLGKFVSAKDNIVTLEIAQNLKVRVLAEDVLAVEVKKSSGNNSVDSSSS